MSPTVFERQFPPQSVIQDSLKGSINQSFWFEDARKRTSYPQLEGEVSADLVIVGGGYLGLWTALLAKERNPARSVILLEGQRVGWAASSRNGGFCEASLTHGEENGRNRWPEEFEQLESLGLKNLQELEATLTRYNMDCDYERTGVMAVAIENYQDNKLHGEGYLDTEAVRAEVNSPTFLSGQWDKHSTAMIHPGKLVVELARVVTELGVTIYEQSAAAGLASRGRGKDRTMQVRTSKGSVIADHVVLATNAFPSLLKRYRLHTIPVYDYVLMTAPMTDAQLASVGWKNRQGIADMGNQFHYYRITKDNRILFGGYDAVYKFGGQIKSEYEERPATFERLASHFFTTFPQLRGIHFSHRWAGAIDTSTRFCAFFSNAYAGRVNYAAGFTGLGVGATRFAANVLLDKTEGLDTERTRLRMVREIPIPFPPEPLTYAAVRIVRWCLNRADHNQGKRNVILRALDALGLGFDS